jgi:hypothetical protein
MTLIVGIKCEDGIVLGADGAATGIVRQAVKKKLRIVDGQVVFGFSGAAGLGQRLGGELEKAWKEKKFSIKGQGQLLPHQVMQVLREGFWQFINYEIDVARACMHTMGPAGIQRSQSSTVVAMPISHELCLFQFDEQASPEQATDDLPFLSIGGGSPIADPFLAFLRRVLWNDGIPTLSVGILSAVWTLRHAIQTCPGGVSDPMQIVTITKRGTSASAVELTPEQITGENIELIEKAEKAIGAMFEMSDGGAGATPPTQDEG